MEIVQFVLLVAGLVALGFSTRQVALVVRLLCWLVGFLFFVVAASLALTSDPDRVGLFTILGDAFNPGPSGSVLSQALGGNWIAGAMAPLFDLFIVFGAIMAIVAAIALTPGDLLERLMRPILVGAIGAMVGCFIALVLVASGMAGAPTNRTYIGRAETDLADAMVIDGDTLRMGDVSMRLAGIDAPEFYAADGVRYSQYNQACREGESRFPCGREARERMVALIRGNILVCRPAAIVTPGLTRDAAGRPVVACEVRPKEGEPFDLAEKLASEGFVDVYRDGGNAPSCSDRVRQLAAQAQIGRRGMWRGVTLTPYMWRNNDDARARFLDPRRPVPDNSLRC